MRPLPGFLHPVVGRVLPCSRSLNRQLDYVKNQFLGPLIEKRQKMEASSDPNYEKPDDFLQWMMDLAKTENESDPHNLAQRLLGITSMAVVHTSAMSLTHILYDLIVMPQWLQPLLDEIQAENPDWKNTTRDNIIALKSTDSFLKESQRLNPPGERKYPHRDFCFLNHTN